MSKEMTNLHVPDNNLREKNPCHFSPFLLLESGCLGLCCWSHFRSRLFLPNWRKSFQPAFKDGLFRPDLRGWSCQPVLFQLVFGSYGN